MTTREEAAVERASKMVQRADRPQRRRAHDGAKASAGVRAEISMREATPVERNGAPAVQVGGYACVTESPYEMYDFFGPYTEIVRSGAFEQTLLEAPLVEFTLNHSRGGTLPMAHTRNGTLDLAEDEKGLSYDAFVDPQRSDVADMVKALERGDLAEASFKFMITAGMWSPDYTEYSITAVDLDRGDVSAVNFGANPAATSGVRSAPRVSEMVKMMLELSRADDARHHITR